ncbi:TPA: DUF333 domain-containing protein [Neisseria bacilliformis]|uniref:Hemolysin n=1 Tax=Neisseria bacilliformis ATCC BAA-1200 TaxID=888742 RepID=F2BDN4_9NEIS|nr:DUF333 domain-containing protein [Neisseria bacilliformis]EGF10484.1 hypothetical protein HMPREF9123_1840 [Neisseria bacilliformis ATCC BAA-1200]QMT46627.1 DUF333 domain-containing protein [Neisseria bacilliformis]
MKNATTLCTLAAAAALAACAAPAEKPVGQPEGAMVGMANPASVFCEQQGGKSEVRKDEQGNEYGMCRLSDGSVVDEWDYYRKNHKE